MTRIIIAFGLCLIACSLQSMQMQLDQASKPLREVMHVTYEENPRQADSFLEEYNRGTVQLNADKSVSFADLDDNTIVYCVSHSQIMDMITVHLLAKKEEIRQKNTQFTLDWLKNTNSDFSPQFKRIAMAFRFIMFHENLDLYTLHTIDPSQDSRVGLILLNRHKYRSAFASAHKAAFDEAKTKAVNAVVYTPFKEYIQSYQEKARKVHSKKQAK